MIDKSIFNEVLLSYKKDFSSKHWENEKYKWEAIKNFKENWDINAKDFREMLNRSLSQSKTGNLLASNRNFPLKMILDFAEIAPEEVRSMFKDLYDERKEIYIRIEKFKQKSNEILESNNSKYNQHFQNENSISTYLWLNYPDKYYIYKIGEVRNVSSYLKSDYDFIRGAYANNIQNFIKFYNEICIDLNNDTELKQLLESKIDSSCYPDLSLHTLTIDFGFYISRNLVNSKSNWYPENYEPGITLDDWKVLLEDKSIFTRNQLEIVKRFKNFGGEATIKQLSNKHGESSNFYKNESIELAKKVANKLNCEVYKDKDGKPLWWALIYLGKKSNDKDGSYIWKLRQEISNALDYVNNISINELSLSYKRYTKDSFLNEVYMTEDRYDSLVSILLNKKNIILQGAPGVGKTFTAKKLAYSIIGEEDNNRIQFVQFHQNYSYEDFMLGYKPVNDGFELKYGVFYQFCQKATSQPDKEFFFIIDEINRGNISKIFGELLMLIEKDYRGTYARLAYNEKPFTVPENLYIIGMMNTADRSLAMIDYALRRRFSFFEIEPGFDSEGFIKYQRDLDNETLNELIIKVKELNKAIMKDKTLGKGFCIGHSYFCGQKTCSESWLRSVVDFDIIPMLWEYWFDEPSKVTEWENALLGVFQ